MDKTLFSELAEELAETSRWLYGHGWSRYNGSNYSARIDDNSIALTTSGKDKGRLAAPATSWPLTSAARRSRIKPSAETGLHTQLYRRFPECGAVLHTHSLHATLLSRRLGAGQPLELQRL